MDDGKKGENGLSRRGFLKGVGTGVIAATVTTTVLSSSAEGAAALSKGIREAVVDLNVNGQAHRVTVKSHWTLLDVLRRQLGLTGTKKGCNKGTCGACTVLMDGQAVYACSILALEAVGRRVLTAEGLAENGKLSAVQQAFSKHGAYQCGFCTCGQMMASKALLDAHPHPAADDVREALAGNVCRCGSYPKIVEAVLDAAGKG